MPRKRKPFTVGCDNGNGTSTLALCLGSTRFDFLKDLNGDVAFPSVLHLTQDGQTLFGFAAVNAERAYPSRSLRFAKRALEDADEHGHHPPIFIHDGRELTAVDATALFLEHLRVCAEQQFGAEIRDLVVTCPANFRDTGRRALMEAARRAGFARVRLLDEPTAAALAYGLDRGVEGKILIADLGAGTFDVTVLEREGGAFRALASGGVQNLGGIDMENLIIRRIAEEHERATGEKTDLLADPVTAAIVREEAQRVKHALTPLASVQVGVVIGVHRVAFELTRTEFEGMIQPLLDQMERCISETVAKAKLSMGGLDHVVLVGGATKVPAVERLVARLTGKELSRDIDRQTAVAQGAALYAQVVNFDDASPDLLDRAPTNDPAKCEVRQQVCELRLICQHALGVEVKCGPGSTQAGQIVLGEVYPAQAPIGQTETRRFAPEFPHQSSVKIRILQGPPMAPSAECRLLGEFVLPIKPQAQVTDSVEVSFSYNNDGVVHVRARDIVSGQVGSQEVSLL